MAEPDVDEDLFADLYDGDDAAETTAAPTKTETDVKQETGEDDTQEAQLDLEQPVIAAGSTGGVEHDMPSMQNDQQGDGMEGMQDFGDYHHDQPEERSIGMKEDG